MSNTDNALVVNETEYLPEEERVKARNGMAALGLSLRKAKWLVSLLTLIGLWWIVSLYLSAQVLPSPLQTAMAMLEDIRDGEIIGHLGITMFRVVFAFMLTMILGITFGCILGLSRKAAEFFNLWMVVGMTVPALVYIVVIFLWLGLSEFSAIIAVTCTTVFTISFNIWEGVKSLDKKLMEMGYIFGAGKKLMYRKVIFPQLMPYIMASARFGLGLTWKMVIFVELMGRPDGIGYMINHWYSLYNMSHVLSNAIIFIIIMLMIELFINRWLEPRLFAWRPKTSR
ncbi:ABC transporter permease [Paenibacillaceae bacterium]|nr:ABC transporter permease [Paenibacillaceae bacterium]